MGGPKILICEDNADQRELLQVFLTSEGYTVLLAEDGRRALALAQTERPALILADLMMPVLDGVALGQRLKADPRTAGIPFILSSAAAGYERACESRFQPEAYLAKPWTWPALLELLGRWIPPPEKNPSGK